MQLDINEVFHNKPHLRLVISTLIPGRANNHSLD
jgi:hypothetical protein